MNPLYKTLSFRSLVIPGYILVATILALVIAGMTLESIPILGAAALVLAVLILFPEKKPDRWVQLYDLLTDDYLMRTFHPINLNKILALYDRNGPNSTMSQAGLASAIRTRAVGILSQINPDNPIAALEGVHQARFWDMIHRHVTPRKLHVEWWASFLYQPEASFLILCSNSEVAPKTETELKTFFRAHLPGTPHITCRSFRSRKSSDGFDHIIDISGEMDGNPLVPIKVQIDDVALVGCDPRPTLSDVGNAAQEFSSSLVQLSETTEKTVAEIERLNRVFDAIARNSSSLAATELGYKALEDGDVVPLKRVLEPKHTVVGGRVIIKDRVDLDAVPVKIED